MRVLAVVLSLVMAMEPLAALESRRRPLSGPVKKSPRGVLLKGGAAKKVVAAVPLEEVSQVLKLVFGAGGIYGAFLYYGSLQEDVFRYRSASGESFRQVWFLQALEALFNVCVGFLGLAVTGGSSKQLPLKLLGCTGATQVLAKYCTNAALARGVSFPVVTLAKSGKMVPVMMGSLLLGGASYSLRQYLQVIMIVGGTAVVSFSKRKGSSNDGGTTLGLAFIVASLAFDGVTGGVQKRVKMEASKRGVLPKPYDYMFWTNVYMLLTALVFAALQQELPSGIAFCTANPEILTKIVAFALCSAVGQSFIFYTIANFDPLVCTTVTTTRKIFSVLLSILLKGHTINATGWAGISMACAGILADVFSKRKH